MYHSGHRIISSTTDSREQPIAAPSPPRVPVATKPIKNLWLSVPDVKLNDLPDLKPLARTYGNKACRPEGSDGSGVRVRVNDIDVALFRFGSQVFATNAQCPHAGGPLEIGDIEDMACGEPCIVCPYHKYRFRLLTGKNSLPGTPEFDVDTYPVKVKQGGRLYIGFAGLSAKCFEDQDF